MSLPSGYKRLEYIESSGTQYIDTGLKSTQDTTLEITFQTSQTSGGGIAVSDENWMSNSFGVWVNAIAFANSASASFYFGDGNIHEFKLDSNAVAWDNGSQIWTGTKTTFTTPSSMTLFCLTRGTTRSEYASMKLYSCRLYNGETLTRDFIPCKNTDGDIGLWDDVNSQFYANAGTGTFAAGPIINLGGIFVKVNGEWKSIDNITINVN